MTNALKRIAKTDFAVKNSEGIRIHALPKGAFTVKQVYELDFFANELMICKMKHENIRKIITYVYYQEGRLDIFSAGFKSKIYLNENHKIMNTSKI
ncbi:MAG: 5'-nucleotidase C-terminal domain-containing protein [Bacteroidales bacterium]